jgi:hypothetical protein
MQLQLNRVLEQTKLDQVVVGDARVLISSCRNDSYQSSFAWKMNVDIGWMMSGTKRREAAQSCLFAGKNNSLSNSCQTCIALPVNQ